MAAPTIASLTTSLTYARKRTAFAWAKYYEATNADHHGAVVHHAVLQSNIADPAIPKHIKNALTEMAGELKKKWDCPICSDMIPDGGLEISNCGHFYCKPCLVSLKAFWATKPESESKGKWECGVCRRKHKLSGDD